MAIFKHIGAPIGASSPTGTKVGSGSICPHCQRQTRFVVVGGRTTCQLCGKGAGDR
jgi:hypothetical protein